VELSGRDRDSSWQVAGDGPVKYRDVWGRANRFTKVEYFNKTCFHYLR